MKKVFLIILGFSLVFSLNAAPVDRHEALNLAVAYLNANMKNVSFESSDLVLLDLSENYSCQNLYAITGEHCFVLLSADDRAFPLLAYSFDNPFSLEFAESTLDWIRSYDREIQSLKDRGIAATEEVRQAWSNLKQGNAGPELNRSAVNPLIHTQWGQRLPYNLYCPGDCVTGCVATAMAQIMKYWEYPNQGTGYHSYTHPDYGVLSASFGSTTYDWDNMPKGASSDSPMAVQQALGTLLYHCGVAFDMEYGTDGSATPSNKVPAAMTGYFGYSSSIELVFKRDGYTDFTWRSLLKNELDASRPLYYAGQDRASAHAFICDGYDSRDYFHFNWGWNGLFDGYYMIGGLNPSQEHSYNVNNYVIKGIEPRPVSVSAPNNLVATVNGSNVQLSWNYASGASYYKVYRDGELIAGHVTGLTYTDPSVVFGHHRYYVKGVSSSGDRSRRSNEAEVLVEVQVSIPTGLFAYVDDSTVELFWTNPTSEIGNLYYKRSGYENDSYGYGGESTTYWAQRYPINKIAEYAGMGVDVVECYFRYEGEYMAYLCKGNQAGVTEIITQQALTITETGTQSFYLDEPFLLDCTKDLWVVMSAPASIPYPVVYTNYDGPGLEDACYLSSDFSSWESKASDQVSWRLAVGLSDCPFIYKVLKDGTLVADSIHDCFYLDSDLSAGTHRYQVIADFNGVESLPSEGCEISLVNVNVRVFGAGTVRGDGFYEDGDYAHLEAIPNPGESFLGWKDEGVTVNTNLEYTFYAYDNRQLEAHFTGVGVAEDQESLLTVYPNPIQSSMHVESNAVIRKVELISESGKVVDVKEVNATSWDGSFEGYAKGVYYLRLVTEKGVTTKKIVLSE